MMYLYGEILQTFSFSFYYGGLHISISSSGVSLPPFSFQSHVEKVEERNTETETETERYHSSMQNFPSKWYSHVVLGTGTQVPAYGEVYVLAGELAPRTQIIFKIKEYQ